MTHPLRRLTAAVLTTILMFQSAACVSAEVRPRPGPPGPESAEMTYVREAAQAAPLRSVVERPAFDYPAPFPPALEASASYASLPQVPPAGVSDRRVAQVLVLAGIAALIGLIVWCADQGCS